MGAEHDFDRDPVDDPSSAGALDRETAPGQGLESPCPQVVVDALVEVAWAFPGVRVSCARLSAPRELTFMASAGATTEPAVSGKTLSFAASPRIARLLAQGHAVSIEDASVDSRLPRAPSLFEEFSMAATLLMPILSGVDNRLIGAVLFDTSRPRTWSNREEVALENVAPLIQLALENRSLRESLEDAHDRNQAHERRAGAIRGIVDAAVHDGRVLLDGLLAVTRAAEQPAPIPDAAAALEKQLIDVLADLVALPDRIAARRDRENVDLNELVVAAAPVLRAVVGTKVRLLVRTDPMPVWVRANRTGLDRLVRTLVTHASAHGGGRDVIVRAYATSEGATIEIGGDAIGTDDRLLSVVTGEPGRSPHDMGIDLWQARCEALLCGGSIRYRVDGDGTKLLIELPSQA